MSSKIKHNFNPYISTKFYHLQFITCSSKYSRNQSPQAKRMLIIYFFIVKMEVQRSCQEEGAKFHGTEVSFSWWQ